MPRREDAVSEIVSFLLILGVITAGISIYAAAVQPELSKAEAAGRTFILAPTADAGVGGVCRDRSKLEALYTIGYQDAEARMEELVRFLEG